jgi:hypothetical protein
MTERSRKIWMVALVFLALFVIAVIAPTNKPAPAATGPTEEEKRTVVQGLWARAYAECQREEEIEPTGSNCRSVAEASVTVYLMQHPDLVGIQPGGKKPAPHPTLPKTGDRP